MTNTDTDHEAMHAALAATGRALVGDATAAEQQKAVDLPSDAPEWVVELAGKIERLERRVSQREEKRRQAVKDLVDRVEQLDKAVTELENIHL